MQWNQLGKRSSVSVQHGNQRVKIGSSAQGIWVNGEWKAKRLDGSYAYDVSTRKLATTWTYAYGHQRFRLETHPALGPRLGYFGPGWHVEVGKRWRVQWQPRDAMLRATATGGWQSNSQFGAEIQWRRTVLSYRTTWNDFGQWRLQVQPVARVAISIQYAQDRWRIQSSQRYSFMGTRKGTGPYIESTAFLHSKGVGCSIGVGKGIHRIYGATGTDRTGAIPWEMGWQTQGKWGRMGMYQVQCTAQKQANWSVQFRISQGLNWNNGGSPSRRMPKSIPIRLECIFTDAPPKGQALLVLKETSTGYTVRFLLEANTVRFEKLPEGRYAVKVFGPNDWEFSPSVELFQASKEASENKLIINANPMYFKNMN